jgi:hypothetical protein
VTDTKYIALVVLAIAFLAAIVAAGALVGIAVAIIVALFGLIIIPGIAGKVDEKEDAK